MPPATLTQAAAVAAAIAAMPCRTSTQWQAQDLAAADAVELIAQACEGNGDACQILLQAVQDLRATVANAQEAEREAA